MMTIWTVRGKRAIRNRYRFELPLPPKEASPNFHGHWRAKHKAVSAYRRACSSVLRDMITPAFVPLEPPVKVHLDFYLCRSPDVFMRWGGLFEGDSFYYPRDGDNARASAKAAQDALIDAGFLKTDSNKTVQVGETRLHTTKKEHKGRTCLFVTLEEV